MSKRKIPYESWVNFFNEFNRKHRSKIVSLTLHEETDKKIADKLPLQELDLNIRDRDNTIVQVVLGENARVTHFIDFVKKIEVEEIDKENPKKILVESNAGVTAEVYFHSLDEA